jgi:hypothetical protein
MTAPLELEAASDLIDEPGEQLEAESLGAARFRLVLYRDLFAGEKREDGLQEVVHVLANVDMGDIRPLMQLLMHDTTPPQRF